MPDSMDKPQFPTWRKNLVELFAWARRKTGFLYGTQLMKILDPDNLQRKIGIQTEIDFYKNFRLYINTQSWVEWILFINGSYERHLRIIFEQFVREGDTVIDIGANIGVHTLTLSHIVGQSGQVIAIEPYPPVLEKLTTHLRINQIQNVDLRPVAVADKKGTAQLVNTQAENESMASLWHDDNETILHEYTVDVCTLDTLLGDNITNLRLIKMDIQGGEYPALLGASHLLERFTPILIFEYDHSWQVAQQSFDDMQKFLSNFGYTLYSVSYRGNILPLNLNKYTEVIALTN